MADVIQHIDDSIGRRALLKPGDKILVAVSGGIDSMVLLHVLKKLSTAHRWRLVVAHFNHRLRGRAADADERLVRKAAAAMRLPVVVERADVKRFARRSKLSVEMAARKLRHEFFARAARARRIKTIALAHHADDQVELFFIRLLRGAGPEGLAGMKWRSPSAADRRLWLVRPLLDLDKAALAAFARGEKVGFREDATNRSDDFLRNRIRNELLPLLRKKYQPALADCVRRLMDLVGAESTLVGDIARQWSDTPKSTGPAFDTLPVAIQRRALHTRLSACGVVADFDLVESLRHSPGVAVSVGANLFVVRDRDGLVHLREQPAGTFDLRTMDVGLKAAGKAVLGEVTLEWRVAAGKVPRFGAGRECFDADRIGPRVILRHWRAGDRFTPIGLSSPKKLQDLFTDAKVPRAQRHRLIVATTASGEIFWVEQLRIADGFKITPSTRRRLIWRWRRN